MYDDKPWEKEDVSPRGLLETKKMNSSTHGSSEVDPTVTQGGSPPKNENFCTLLQQSLKYDNSHCRNFSSQGGWGEGGGGYKRKPPSSADTDSGCGGEWKASRKRRKHRVIARSSLVFWSPTD
ncbi:hypothetical protein HU200_018779 [Digitaria exilis]|uniref:Uncharacterized protein n=1 Tax=Digitaria exilis TaxID=1010633 RepID=A0A835F531_9POAL|nr:hypothetical protein HU200_018779 [Digitaria exilis]